LGDDDIGAGLLSETRICDVLYLAKQLAPSGFDGSGIRPRIAE
jgi:hypothetical protein